MKINNALKLLSVILLCSLGTKTFADDVWIAQRLLTQLGYSPGPADGLYGRKTRAALDAFYKDQGSIFDGKLDQNEIGLLRKVSGNEDNLLLDVESKPKGVLSPSKTKKLWNAYKVASQCFEHPTYGKGNGIKINVLTTDQLKDVPWTDPFAPKTPTSGNVSAYSNPPQPVVTVRLNESYGSRDTRIDNAAALSILVSREPYDSFKRTVTTGCGGLEYAETFPEVGVFGAKGSVHGTSFN